MTYGYSEPENYVPIFQKWVLRWGRRKLWTKWVEVGEIPLFQWCAHATMGDPILTQEQIEEFSKIKTRKNEQRTVYY